MKGQCCLIEFQRTDGVPQRLFRFVEDGISYFVLLEEQHFGHNFNQSLCLFLKSSYICILQKQIMDTQGQRVRRIRDEKGIKQKFISETTGITQAHLSRIENDESGVTRNTLRKIAAALNVSFESIYIPKPKARTDSAEHPPVDIDDVLASESAMVRFMGGNRPDNATMEWVRRSLDVIREEVRRHR